MLQNYLSLIKFSHTIFALPFALVGFFLGVIQKGEGRIPFDLLAYVILAMVFARSAAMAFNRYADRKIDKANPRTAQREIAAGIIKPHNALIFILINVGLFVFTSWLINPLCFSLSPIALLVVLGYSYTKRFTSLSHYVLGIGLGLAPVGAYLAVTGEFGLIPILYGFVVFTWVAGFDIIYSLQDERFDKTLKLHSIPTFLGSKNALLLSTVTHLITAILMIYAVYLSVNQLPQIGWLTWIGALVFIGSLIYQHLIVKSDDLSRVNMAFFTTNGIASVVFGLLFVFDYFL
ncbi:MAG TPA: 4-hydroxybenzoate octaprenyltransferase [Saprospiraceae bacterium]|nr:4-hydroxybenzoate octaprenyltransferase [Saprospiraceae bacterium]